MAAARLKVHPTTYDEALSALGGHVSRLIGNNTYLIRQEAAVSVRLHATDILTFHADGFVSLRTGGYRTVTTRERLRSLGVPLYVERGEWSIRTANVPGLGGAIDAPFTEDMRIRQERLSPRGRFARV